MTPDVTAADIAGNLRREREALEAAMPALDPKLAPLARQMAATVALAETALRAYADLARELAQERRHNAELAARIAALEAVSPARARLVAH